MVDMPCHILFRAPDVLIEGVISSPGWSSQRKEIAGKKNSRCLWTAGNASSRELLDNPSIHLSKTVLFLVRRRCHWPCGS